MKLAERSLQNIDPQKNICISNNIYNMIAQSFLFYFPKIIPILYPPMQNFKTLDNALCTLNRTNRTPHNLSSVVVTLLQIFWQSLMSQCKFIMPKAIKLDELSICISIFYQNIHKDSLCVVRFNVHKTLSVRKNPDAIVKSVS